MLIHFFTSMTFNIWEAIFFEKDQKIDPHLFEGYDGIGYLCGMFDAEEFVHKM